MVWVNIDKPTKRYVIHEEKCVYVELFPKKRDKSKYTGGWFHFLTLREAEAPYYEKCEPKGFTISVDGCCCHRAANSVFC
jgi:hypothetical protein